MERNLIELNPRREGMGETPHKCLPPQPHEKCIPAISRGKTKAAELVKMFNDMLAGVRGTTPQPTDKQDFSLEGRQWSSKYWGWGGMVKK